MSRSYPGYLNIWISEYLDIWISGYLNIWISGYLNIWIFGYLNIWISGYLNIWICEYLVCRQGPGQSGWRQLTQVNTLTPHSKPFKSLFGYSSHFPSCFTLLPLANVTIAIAIVFATESQTNSNTSIGA